MVSVSPDVDREGALAELGIYCDQHKVALAYTRWPEGGPLLMCVVPEIEVGINSPDRAKGGSEVEHGLLPLIAAVCPRDEGGRPHVITVVFGHEQSLASYADAVVAAQMLIQNCPVFEARPALPA